MTSPMGWNSRDCYGAAVSEETVRKNAEYMADKLKKNGWEYIVVDIQWYEPTAQSHEYHPFTELYKETAAMWRITDDFLDKWRLLYGMFERCEKWCTHTGFGNYPDADMLPIGAIRQEHSEDDRTKFTEDEQYTMLTLRSIFRSPLFIGGEITKFDKFTLGLITNEGILDMHKNARHAHQVFRKTIDGNELILWIAACAYGGSYIALFNAGESTAKYTLDLENIELEGELHYTELWSAADGTGSIISCEIPPTA